MSHNCQFPQAGPKLRMLMVRDLSSELDDVKEDVRAGNVTLGM